MAAGKHVQQHNHSNKFDWFELYARLYYWPQRHRRNGNEFRFRVFFIVIFTILSPRCIAALAVSVKQSTI